MEASAKGSPENFLHMPRFEPDLAGPLQPSPLNIHCFWHKSHTIILVNIGFSMLLMVIIITSCKVNRILFPVAINHLKKCPGNLFSSTPLSSWHCLYFFSSFYFPVSILKQSIVFLCTVQSNHGSLLHLWNKSSPELKFSLPTKLEE